MNRQCRLKLMRPFCKASACLGIIASFWISPARAIDNPGLAGVHQNVVGQFGEVRHIEPRALKALRSKDVLLIDVREPDEFAVSHLRGAQRVSPDISASAFVEKYGARVAGKRVVFYCSVGQRSSKLADLVQHQLIEAGARSVQSLAGGIFNWHNQHNPLVNGHGPTEFVHPYSWWWGRHLERDALRRYEPASR